MSKPKPIPYQRKPRPKDGGDYVRNRDGSLRPADQPAKSIPAAPPAKPKED